MLDGNLYSNFQCDFEFFLYLQEKKCERIKVVFYHKDYEIKVFFSKIVHHVPNFCIFYSVYIVQWNFKSKFLKSAQKCTQGINFGKSTIRF